MLSQGAPRFFEALARTLARDTPYRSGQGHGWDNESILQRFDEHLPRRRTLRESFCHSLLEGGG